MESHTSYAVEAKTHAPGARWQACGSARTTLDSALNAKDDALAKAYSHARITERVVTTKIVFEASLYNRGHELIMHDSDPKLISSRREDHGMEVKTLDHPEANGRKAQEGETEYVATFTLDDGRVLRVRMGQRGFETTTSLLMDMLTNAPSHDDGSLKS